MWWAWVRITLRTGGCQFVTASVSVLSDRKRRLLATADSFHYFRMFPVKLHRQFCEKLVCRFFHYCTSLYGFAMISAGSGRLHLLSTAIRKKAMNPAINAISIFLFIIRPSYVLRLQLLRSQSLLQEFQSLFFL